MRWPAVRAVLFSSVRPAAAHTHLSNIGLTLGSDPTLTPLLDSLLQCTRK